MQFERKPLWYKDAVIYEVHVKSYLDTDGSGMGDFRGLISKLDYIRDLGVTAIWLLPFYPSPLRDDGYDIADYREVNPAYGTLELFREFLDAAHARGMYVITEVVINHTSDQHPWFQKARQASPGSPERDLYVWNDTPGKYKDARIIFRDFEASNWTWDPIAKAYYWHRFYSHQPDLNFDNPAVHQAVFDILDYWLSMGVDGLRLDAIPYLYERDETSCENLPETHAFIRRLASHVHARYDHRMLLAEANQWPDDAAAYFGDGEGCDMAFHFPLMTRLYMAVEMEDRFPMVDILEQTPRIPDHCQWAIFLRNHDELTLEMVTDEERDYMYRVFAKDRRARINLGIRRRLAPLLGNNRRKIELLNALLFSLPGTPVVYYGDEIGMGDNFLLGDRDGVRTPMQWSAEANAGFSSAPPEKLYLPVIADSENHYAAVNVALQEANSASLLWWMRRRIKLRQSHPVFGRGTLRFLEAKNSRVLAFVRESEEEAVLVLANLSQYAQTAQLDLGDFRGAQPVELAGRTRFEPVGEGAYPVMLGAHDALWILLRRRTEDDLTREVRSLPDAGQWPSVAEWAARSGWKVLSEFHAPQAPWFLGKARTLARVRLLDAAAAESSGFMALHAVLRAEYLDAEAEEYSVWLAFVREPEAEGIPAQALVARLTIGEEAGYLCEARYLRAFRTFLLDGMLQPGRHAIGAVVFEGPEAQETQAASPAASRSPAQLEETRSGEFSLLSQNEISVRWFQRLHEEVPADFAILAELNARFPEARVPVITARAEYRPESGEVRTAGYATRFAHADRNARDLAREGLKRFLEAVATAKDPSLPSVSGRIPARLGFHGLPAFLQEALGGSWAEFVSLLGRQLAELHRQLAGCGENPAFAPDSFTTMYRHSLYHSVRGRVRRAFLQLERNAATLPDEQRAPADRALSVQATLLRDLQRLTTAPVDGQRIRIHGDLGLERARFTGKDFVFTGFDGPPWLSFAERGLLFSPLQDVAALLRDLMSLPDGDVAGSGETQATPKEPSAWAEAWAEISSGIFLEGYLSAAAGAGFLPSTQEGIDFLLEIFLLERTAYDLQSAVAASGSGSAGPDGILSALRIFLRSASVANGPVAGSPA